jgi:ABC-type amino acid transport substrate-binding protein
MVMVAVPARGQGLPPDIQRIKDRGKLIVAMYYRDIIPFLFTDKKGNFIGHDVELAKDIAKKLGVECEFNRTPKTFNEIVDKVVSHEADIAISLISATLARAERVRFTDPYIVLHQSLIVNRLTASRYTFMGADPLAEIRNTTEKIGEKKGTSYVNIAKNAFKKATVVEYEEWEASPEKPGVFTMEAVEKGEVFAALRDEIGVKNLITQKPELAIRLKMVILKNERDPLAIAVPSDSTHLLDWINIYLKQYHPPMSADDLLSQYAEHYKK